MNAIILSLKDRITTGLQQMAGLVGAVAVGSGKGETVLSEGCGLLLLLVLEDREADESITHYMLDGIRIQERRIACSELKHRLQQRKDPVIYQWMATGEIWMDAQAELAAIRSGIEIYPEVEREQKLLGEFSIFVKRYLQCKEFLHEDKVLDAYSAILRAIHHWARIVVLESGSYPDAGLWQQVRKVNSGVYKLYEELTLSGETLKQRVELVLLASEFSVMSKMESCCSLLLRILETAQEPLGIQELRRHPLLQDRIAPTLPLLLNKLARKSLVREVAVATETDLFFLELKYTKA